MSHIVTFDPPSQDVDTGTLFVLRFSVQRVLGSRTNEICSGLTAGAFGAVAGIFAIFFFGEIPKVRKDILSNLPLVGGYFVREIPPEDNPF